jgi:hypothetical protein
MTALRVVHSTAPHTAQRRATLPLATLRTAKLSAGDWIRLSTDTASVIAQAWPSLTLGEDEVVLSRVHELALGDPVEVTLDKVGDVRWMTAKAVTVAVQNGEKEGRKADKAEREVAWELALLKEVLRTSGFL